MRMRVQIRKYIECSEPDTCGCCLPLQQHQYGVLKSALILCNHRYGVEAYIIHTEFIVCQL